MQEIESLILEVKSQGLRDANAELSALDDKARKAETATENLTTATDALDRSATETADAVQKETASAKALSDVLARLDGVTDRMSAAAGNLEKASAALAASMSKEERAAHGATDAIQATERATEALARAENRAEHQLEQMNHATEIASTVNMVNSLTLRQVVVALASHAAATVSSTVSTAAQTVATTASATALTAWNAVAATATAITAGFTAVVTAVTVAMAALVVPILALTALTDATRKFQDFQAQLKTATGSIENATTAYGALEEFASTTPYSLDAATSSFVKLVNYGLTPSERALRSYGNTASAMNKDIMDFIEAVADATTGENERLKEFGIKAAKMGDEVAFTFRGVTTTVKNEAGAIEEYLIQLGENNFANAMSDRMQTLGGAISNLGDAWSKFLVNVSNLGAGNLITDAFREAVAVLDELNAQLSSGQFEASMESWKIAVKEWFDVFFVAVGDGDETITKLGETVEEETSNWTTDFMDFGDDFKEVFARFPAEVKRHILLAGTNLKFLIVYGYESAKEMVRVMLIQFASLVDKAKLYGQAIGHALNPFAEGSFGLDSKLADVDAATAKLRDETAQKSMDAISEYDRVLDKERAVINEGADAVKRRFEYAEEYASVLRELSDDIKNDAKSDPAGVVDVLAGFKVQADPGESSATGLTKGKKKGAGGGRGKSAADEALAERQRQYEQELELLISALTKEDEVLSEHFERKKETILENTALTEQERTGLVLELLGESLLSEEEAIAQSYENRKNAILQATALTETTRAAMIARIDAQMNKEQLKARAEQQKQYLDVASEFFGNLSALAASENKKMAKIGKAAAIAQTTIKTYEAAMSAYASAAAIPYVGYILGPIAAAAAVAAGAMQVASIKSTNYSGAYEHGGLIPGGSVGLVGEAGPELVRGPAVVTSARTTAAGMGDSAGFRTVTVNNFGPPIEVKAGMSREEFMIEIRPMLAQTKKEAKAEVASDIRQGGKEVSAAISGSYDISRKGR